MEQTEQQAAPAPAPKKKGGMGRIGLVLLLIILLGIAAFIYFNPGFFGDIAEKTDSNVVATVNGAQILQSAIDERIERNQSNLLSQGIDATNPDTRSDLESQVLDQLINEELVLAAAAQAGLSATDAEVTAQLDSIKSQFDTTEAFEAQLVDSNFTEESLKESLKRDLTIQKYIDQLASNSDAITVSEEEISSAYDEFVAANEDAQPLEELHDQIEAALRQQKLALAVAAAVQSLKDSADIVIEDDEAQE